MAKDGWVKIHRQIQDSKVWKIKPYSWGQAWVDLIVSANHKPGCIVVRGIPINIDTGQVGHSVKTLAARWGWSRGKVERFLKWLKSEHQIEHQKNNVSTVITITNWEQYQETEQQNGHQTDTKRTPNGHQTDTNKNEKNEKNGKKKKRKAFIPPSVEDVNAYAESRGCPGFDGQKFVDFYESSNWIDTQGNPVRNWKQKFIGVWEGKSKKGGNGKPKPEPVRGDPDWLPTEEEAEEILRACRSLQ